MGRFDVTTATKVSRTAHEPACCAPLMGSVRMRTQRRMPAMVTKMPPEKSRMSPTFFAGLSDALQSMGMGMLKRYKSVRTFKTTVTKISIFEMAGWQKSEGFPHSQRLGNMKTIRGTYCRGRGRFASSSRADSSQRESKTGRQATSKR